MILPFLNVTNINKSVAFYEKLGFTKTMEMAGPDGEPAMAFVMLNDDNIGLGRAMPDSEEQIGAPGANFMVYLKEDQDIDAFCDEVKARGVSLLQDIKTEYWGDRMFAAVDPDGYVISIVKTVQETDMDYAAAVMRGEITPDSSD